MKTIWILIINCFLSLHLFGQISQGVITFERTINIYKKYKDYKDIKKWIPEKDKYRKDIYELHFNDTLSVFFPTIETETNTWTASCNTVTMYPNQKIYEAKQHFNLDELLVLDSIPHRTWKLTNKWRKILDYDCRQAVYQFDDTIRIYAWFTPAIAPSIGPETMWDLPGGILGLALEDGSITYFATKVESKPLDWINTKQRFNTKKAKSKAEHRIAILGKEKEKPNEKKEKNGSNWMEEELRDTFMF